MSPLITRLQTLTGPLTVAGGTPADALAALRTLAAAILIQSDASLLPIGAGEDDDPAIVDAARKGEALAAERAATGTRSRFVKVALPDDQPSAERIAATFGPFADGDGGLVEFRVVDIATFLMVATQADVLDDGDAVVMVLPIGTTANANASSFAIPPGTVLVPAARLVPGAAGYAMLRVAGGTLELATRALGIAGNELQLRRETDWQLILEPEAPPPGGPDGADGNAVGVVVPSQLFISAEGRNSVSGPIGIAGFGSSLRFDLQSGAPSLTDTGIMFPFATAGEAWTLERHRSALAALSGDGVVQQAIWVLPVTSEGPGAHAEAAGGGTIGVVLTGTLRCMADGVAGTFELRDPGILADASGLTLVAASREAAAGLDLSLWSSSRSRVAFSRPARGVRFHSRRDGADSLTLVGGVLANRWNLPLAASGKPFDFVDGSTTLTLVAEPGGLRRTLGQAQRAPTDSVHGLALQNFFVEVGPIGRVRFAGSGGRSGELAEGQAQLVFDVRHGEPMLPDPYSGSWPLVADPQQVPIPVAAALAVVLDWAAGAAPDMRVRFDRPIPLPLPSPFGAGEVDGNLAGAFIRHLDEASDQDIGLLDLSTREDHFGIALSLRDARPAIANGTRVAVPLAGVRLLMQPQVHWEPVQVPPSDGGMLLTYASHGGRTLVGSNSVRLVPALPGIVAERIAAAAGRTGTAAALFSLPFGLRALTFIDPDPDGTPSRTMVEVRRNSFAGGTTSARQFRLERTGPIPGGVPDPARTMPGTMRQTFNDPLSIPPPSADFNPPVAVLPPSVRTILQGFEGVPLHGVDLSGYGLSCFSDWRSDADSGLSKARFDVLLGRTSYEVIQVRSLLAPCQSRVVRTVILERKNSGRVERFDSGWQAVDDGTFNRHVTFDTGAVRALRRIRRIRELGDPPFRIADGSLWREVRFDADADIEGLAAGGGPTGTAALDHRGFIQIEPGLQAKEPRDTLKAKQVMRALFDRTGPIGGPVDCRIRLGATLDMQLSALFADFAPVPGFAANDPRSLSFAVGAYGMPDFPRAGRWSGVRIDGHTSDIAAVDAARGMPVSRAPGGPFVFRDPAELRLGTANAEYGLLVTTPSSRVLFPRPTVDPGPQPGRLLTDPPRLADPVALVQASGVFPRAGFAMVAKESAAILISDANAWRLADASFSFDPRTTDIASGGGWGLTRDLAAGETPSFDVRLDSELPALPLKLDQPVHDIILKVAKGELLRIATTVVANSDGPAVMPDPKVIFGPVLDELTEIVTALSLFTNIKLPMGVTVTVVPGLNPAFQVHLDLNFEVGTGKDGPVDIGLGKFAGSFQLTGELQAALTGDTSGRLKLTFDGAVQQAILPPLLYAGGVFHFAIEVRDSGDPLIELGLGTTTSIGGDLIKGLIEVEATIKYGYLLMPQTLQPGVMLGIEARAKLLAGLFSLSFGADAVARITRLNEDKTVTIFADIHVAASIQVAFLFDEDVDFRTQFEQNLPLAPLLVIAGINPLVAIATSAVL